MGLTLEISESMCLLFFGDRDCSGSRSLILGVEVLSPLVFVGCSGGTKTLGMLAIRNLGV